MGHLGSEQRGWPTLRRPIASKVAPKVSWFYRALYRSYSLGSLISLFFNRRVTPVGWGILSLLLLTTILGVDFSKSTLYQLFSLIVGALAVSLVCRSRRPDSLHFSDFFSFFDRLFADRNLRQILRLPNSAKIRNNLASKRPSADF